MRLLQNSKFEIKLKKLNTKAGMLKYVDNSELCETASYDPESVECFCCCFQDVRTSWVHLWGRIRLQAVSPGQSSFFLNNIFR